MQNSKYSVSSTPHIRSNDSIEKIMKDVIIALTPAALAGVYFFGMRALLIIVISIASSLFFEALYQKTTKQPITINDYSPIVTGLLLAMNLPSTVPFWIPIVGSFFAIVIVKQLFGGLGQNFMNPALAARAFLFIAYSKQMSHWAKPLNGFFNMTVDAVSSPTPLELLKSSNYTITQATNFIPNSSDFMNAFIGNIGGSIGETSAVLLIIGGLFLLARKVINWRIPFTFIATVAILSFILGRNGSFYALPIYELITGGLLLGAIFMATDYSSSPVTETGQIIMGIGCGFLTIIIRSFGNYPEGVSFAILLMNLVVPLLDKYTKPRVFGVKEAKKYA